MTKEETAAALRDVQQQIKLSYMRLRRIVDLIIETRDDHYFDDWLIKLRAALDHAHEYIFSCDYTLENTIRELMGMEPEAKPPAPDRSARTVANSLQREKERLLEQIAKARKILEDYGDEKLLRKAENGWLGTLNSAVTGEGPGNMTLDDVIYEIEHP